MTTPIALLVVDDHTLFRRGLVALLSQDGRFHVAGEAGDIGEALRCVERSKPDLILLDNHLPGVLGVDGIATLKDAAPGTRILMLTVSENEDDLSAALQAGANWHSKLTQSTNAFLANLLRLEIELGLESPPELAAERLKTQVAVLQSSLRSGHKSHSPQALLRQLCEQPALLNANDAVRLDKILTHLHN